MKDYKRLTNKYYPCVACKNGKCLEPRYDCKEKEECEAWNRLFELEDKIESGKLCDREEVRKETASDIAEMLRAAKGVVKVHFEAYDELIDNIAEEYGVKEELK